MYTKWQLFKWYFPFRINFFILLLVLVCAWKIIKTFEDTSNSFYPLILAMCKVAIVFCLVLFIISFLSIVVSFLYFKKQMKLNQSNMTVKFAEDSKWKVGAMQVQVKIEKVWLPLMGYLKMQLVFADSQVGAIWNLLETGTGKGIIIKSWNAFTVLQLPNIKSYNVQQGILFFQDFLRLYSLPIFIKTPNVFWNLPILVDADEVKMQPQKTELLEQKIDTLRRVDGELLHYKKYSPADDTRRIVWKIYAKNRELVIRNPEIFNPYASHLNFYVSYFNTFTSPLTFEYNDVMLSFYKQKIFDIYTKIGLSKIEVIYISDQQVTTAKDVSKIITASEWQFTKNISEFVNWRNAAAIVLHSGNAVQDVQETLNKISKNTIIYFIKTTDVFKPQGVFSKLQKIFLHPSKSTLTALSSNWHWHPLKQVYQNNEVKIIELLSTHANVQFI